MSTQTPERDYIRAGLVAIFVVFTLPAWAVALPVCSLVYGVGWLAYWVCDKLGVECDPDCWFR